MVISIVSCQRMLCYWELLQRKIIRHCSGPEQFFIVYKLAIHFYKVFQQECNVMLNICNGGKIEYDVESEAQNHNKSWTTSVLLISINNAIANITTFLIQMKKNLLFSTIEPNDV